MTNLVRMTGIELRFFGLHALVGDNGAGKSKLRNILSDPCRYRLLRRRQIQQ